jgi:hypothetical protein
MPGDYNPFKRVKWHKRDRDLGIQDTESSQFMLEFDVGSETRNP